MGVANPTAGVLLVVADPEDGDLDPFKRPRQGRPCAASAAWPGDTGSACVKTVNLLGCPLEGLRIAKPSDLNQVHALQRGGRSVLLGCLGAGPLGAVAGGFPLELVGRLRPGGALGGLAGGIFAGNGGCGSERVPTDGPPMRRVR